MLKKLQVLAGALRLTTFTVAELSKACGVSQNTIHTALARMPEDWLKSTVVPGGTRGGQQRRYVLSVAGAKGIRQTLGRLPSAASSVLVEAADEPIGLSAARASLERILQADSSTARVLSEDASRSLEWAEAEMSDGGFAANAPALRAQIEDLRARIESASKQRRKVSRRDIEAFASTSKAAKRVAVKKDLTRSTLIEVLAEMQRDLEKDSIDVEHTVNLLQELVDHSHSRGTGIVSSDVYSERSCEPRTIKKYPNKRLYDTVESRYITLSDIRKLVMQGIDFVIIDKKRQQDITRSVLLQVVAEQERGAEPLMSRDFLLQIIRSRSGEMQGEIGRYLEQSLNLFASQQSDAREHARVLGTFPVNDLAQKFYQRWRQVRDEIYRTLSNTRSDTSDSTNDEKVSATDWMSAGAHKE